MQQTKPLQEGRPVRKPHPQPHSVAGLGNRHLQALSVPRGCFVNVQVHQRARPVSSVATLEVRLPLLIETPCEWAF